MAAVESTSGDLAAEGACTTDNQNLHETIPATG
jgi:hypothetical protein